MGMLSAPREEGLKRPPWRIVWSCALKCVSWGVRDASSAVKSSGFSGSGAVAVAEGASGREGEFAAGAILRFLRVGGEAWKRRDWGWVWRLRCVC